MNQTAFFSLEESYRRNIDTVYRVCLSLTGNPNDAQDAAQAVFLKLLEQRRVFESAEHERAWLIRVARNHCLDLRRYWKRRQTVGLEQLEYYTIAEHWDHEQRETFLQLLELPPKHRLILYLHYYEGYSIKEIGQILRCGENTVKSRLHAARKRLKLELEEEQP